MVTPAELAAMGCPEELAELAVGPEGGAEQNRGWPAEGPPSGML